MEPLHVPTTRLKQFLLEQIELEDHEHVHIINCSQCLHDMVADEIEERRDAAGGSRG